MTEATPVQPRVKVAEAIGQLWWLPLLRGIMFIILGCYAFMNPGMTAMVLAKVIGFFVIIEGVFLVTAGITGNISSRGWTIVRGLIEIFAGCFVFAYPFLFTVVAGTYLVYMLAFAAILSGVMESIAAIKNRKQIEGGGWIICGGIFSVIFGLVLLSNPLSFGAFVVRILGALSIFSGFSMIAFAFRLRKFGKKMDGQASSSEEG